MKCKVIDKHDQGIDTGFFSKEQLARIDVDGLTRHFITFEFDFDGFDLVIADFIRSRYRLPVKTLSCPQDVLSFQYRAQKRPVIGGSKGGIEESLIQVEPSNSNIRDFISRIPINQHLAIGTTATIDVRIPYDEHDDGTIEDLAFISSNNLHFDSKVERPCLRWCHIGAIDIGSELRAKYEVRMIDPDVEKRCLFGFRRPGPNKLTLWIYDFYQLSILDILNQYVEYLKNYKPPQVQYLDANNFGYRLNCPEKCLEFVESMIKAMKE